MYILRIHLLPLVQCVCSVGAPRSFAQEDSQLNPAHRHTAIMSLIVNLPHELIIALLDDHIEWKGLARLDSALCVRALRPKFLARISGTLRANDKKSMDWTKEQSIFIDDYLSWVNLRAVPSVSYLDFLWCKLSQNADRVHNWGTFKDVVHVEQVFIRDDKMMEFVDALWTHCPNVEYAWWSPAGCVGYPPTMDKIFEEPQREYETKRTNLLNLFRSCRKLRTLETFLFQISDEELGEVPKSLRFLAIGGHDEKRIDIGSVIKLISNLDGLEGLDLKMDHSYPAELYATICKYSGTFAHFSMLNNSGYAGFDMMLQQCTKLQHISLLCCTDLTQELFTMMFSLPSLTFLHLRKNNTIPGLGPTYNTTSVIECLQLNGFHALVASDHEVNRVLLACPHLKPGCCMEGINKEFVLANRDLCKHLWELERYTEVEEF